MRYLITFLEGIISFLSPCMLPLLPLYITYFAGGDRDRRHVFGRALCFMLGFTLIFCALGLFAGTFGGLLSRHRQAVNVVCGLLVILLGLSYLEILPLRFLKGMQGGHEAGSLLSAFVFGLIYALNLTPCIGAFLGSALMLAAAAGGAAEGLTLLLAYSLGMGLPFVLSAVLLDRLKGTFDFIKRHYGVLNTACGIFLLLIGAAMALGRLDGLLRVIQ